MVNNKPIRVLQVLHIMNRGGAEAMIMNLYRKIDRTKVQFDFWYIHKSRDCLRMKFERWVGGYFVSVLSRDIM